MSSGIKDLTDAMTENVTGGCWEPFPEPTGSGDKPGSEPKEPVGGPVVLVPTLGNS